MTFKNIRIKKPGGGTRLQRVKVLKSGKYKFVKNLTKSRKKSSSNPSKKGGNKSMGKTRKTTIPLAPIAGLAPTVIGVWSRRSSPKDAVNHLARSMVGFDINTGQFTTAELGQGILPLLAGLAVHKLAARFGINRMLAQAGVPVIRI